MPKNQKPNARMRREHDEARMLSTVVARTIHQLQHDLKEAAFSPAQ